MADESMESKQDKPKKTVVVANTPLELQRMKLEKLMKNPTKEVVIQERSKEYNPKAPPEFIRNVWGSSAGAGSGDFHVYRGVRRREYARQKFISEKAKKDSLDEEYHRKVEENKKAAEERTAKKRAKRLKKKAKAKGKRMKKDNQQKKSDTEESEESEEEEEEDKKRKEEAANTEGNNARNNSSDNTNDSGNDNEDDDSTNRGNDASSGAEV